MIWESIAKRKTNDSAANPTALSLRARLITCHSFLSLLRQRVEIVAFFLKQAVLNQTFYRIENCGARVRIVLAGFEECMQIEFFSFPEFKTSQNAFVDFIHGGIKGQAQLRLFLFHVSHH